jgi:hypothetical protein
LKFNLKTETMRGDSGRGMLANATTISREENKIKNAPKSEASSWSVSLNLETTSRQMVDYGWEDIKGLDFLFQKTQIITTKNEPFSQ